MTTGGGGVFVSTACLGGDKSYRRVLDAFAAANVTEVELTGVHPHLPDARLEALVREYQATGLRFLFHNYFPPPPDTLVLNFLAQDDTQRRRSEAVITGAVRLAGRTGVPLYAFHPGYYRNGQAHPSGHFLFDPDEPRLSPAEAMARFRRDFGAFYHGLGLDGPGQATFVAIENLFPPSHGENNSFLCTVEEIDELFDGERFRDSNIGLLIDLGHLTIAANVLGFDRDRALARIVERHGDRIYEVHLSENNGREDLHRRVTADSWQLHALEAFAGTGARAGGTCVCIESRGMTVDDIRRDRDLVRQTLER